MVISEIKSDLNEFIDIVESKTQGSRSSEREKMTLITDNILMENLLLIKKNANLRANWIKLRKMNA